MGYAMTKAAFERVARLLEVEHGADGTRAFNIDPGHVATERQIASGRAKQYEGNFTGRNTSTDRCGRRLVVHQSRCRAAPGSDRSSPETHPRPRPA